MNKRWEGGFAEFWAVGESQSSTSGRQIGRREGFHGVGVETHVAGNVSQRWHVNSADVSEGHIGGAQKIGEADLQVHGVCREEQLVGNILQVVDIDSAEIWVVVDIENPNMLELNTTRRVELGIGDENVGCLLNTLGEVETLQRRQADPVDLIDACEGIELKVGQSGHALQAPGASDGVELVGREG